MNDVLECFLPHQWILPASRQTHHRGRGRSNRDDHACPKLQSGLSAKFLGFTIVELMVVVVILGLLAGAVVINVSGYIAKSRQERARMDIASLKSAVELFYLERKRYPTSDEGLAILAQSADDRSAGLIPELPNDPWGNSYIYLCPGQHGAFDIMSLGRDGAQGGQGEDADIVSWQLSGEAQEK